MDSVVEAFGSGAGGTEYRKNSVLRKGTVNQALTEDSPGASWPWYTALFAGILGWGSTLAFQIAVGSSLGIAMVTIKAG